MVVVAGMGHTDKTNGIPPRVARRLPGIEQAVVLNSQPREIDPATADFVLFSPPAQLPPAPMIGVMLEDTQEGLKVAGLAEEGKAKEAGIRKDDIILSLDNEPVRKLEDLKIAMFFKNKGDTIHLHLKRKGFWGDRIIRVEITL
jgi:S1-C subfamily serine protease